MGEDQRVGACEAETVDEAGMTECVTAGAVGWIEQRGQNADVELIPGWKQDGVVGLDEACEAVLDAPMLGKVAADQARSSGAGGNRRVLGWSCGAREVEIVIAAKADARTAVDAVGDALPMRDGRKTACQAGAVEGMQLAAQTLVESRGHGRRE